MGISSLGDVDRRARALCDDNVRTTQAANAVGGGLYEVEETAFRLLLARGGADEVAELADTMQLSEAEVEAYDLLRRHLERAIRTAG